MAALGPAFDATTVKVTFVKTDGAALLTVLVTPRFTCGTGVVATVAVLFAGVISASAPDMVAVLLYEPVPFTVAIMVNVAEAAFAKLPTAQFGAVQVPTDGVALTNV